MRNKRIAFSIVAGLCGRPGYYYGGRHMISHYHFFPMTYSCEITKTSPGFRAPLYHAVGLGPKACCAALRGPGPFCCIAILYVHSLSYFLLRPCYRLVAERVNCR